MTSRSACSLTTRSSKSTKIPWAIKRIALRKAMALKSGQKTWKMAARPWDCSIAGK